jgi:hypothetical protein
MEPGETQTFAASLPAPSADSLTGPYYLALFLSIEQEPGSARHHLRLSAGDSGRAR